MPLPVWPLVCADDLARGWLNANSFLTGGGAGNRAVLESGEIGQFVKISGRARRRQNSRSFIALATAPVELWTWSLV